jgi:hypothetical protein
MNYLCFYSFIFGVETKVMIGIHVHFNGDRIKGYHAYDA